MADYEDDEVPQIEDLVAKAVPNKFIANFIVIAEVFNEDGGTELSLVTSESMSPWLALGMIQSAHDMVLTQHRMSDYGEDD
jgi:hypothetical protein